MDRSRIIPMFLPAASSFVFSQTVQRQIRFQPQRIEGSGVAFIGLSGNILQRDASHPAGRSVEILIDHFLGNTDGFEYLGALVGLNGGNSHFGSDFYDAVQDCQIIILHCSIIIFIKQSFVDQLPDGIQRQIGVYRTGAVSQQRGKMMHFPWLSGFQDQRQRRLFFRVDQMLVNGGNRQKRRHGHMIFIHPTVGKYQDIGAVLIRFIHLHKQPVDRTLQFGALIISNGNDRNLKTWFFHVFDFQHIRIGQNRIINF